MRKVISTAAVLTLCAAPAAAQQIEKSPFTAAPAREQAADVAEPKDEAAQQETKASLRVSQKEMDETIRAVAEERGQGRQQIGTNFWYTVAAIALGIIIASLLLS